MKEVILQVEKIIDANLGLTPNEGDILFKRIDEHLSRNEKIFLDFSNINILTTAFLNAAVGQLYGKYSSTHLNNFLSIKNLSPENLPLLLKVIVRAKEYFKNKPDFEDSANRNISDD